MGYFSDPQITGLIVGIGNYPKLPTIPNTAQDAKALHNQLVHTQHLASDDTLRLLHEEQATLKNIRQGIQQLGETTPPRASIFLFFAGHGLRMFERETYFCPYDTDPSNIPDTALPLSELRAALDTMRLKESDKGSNIVIFLDCRYIFGSGDVGLPAGFESGLTVADYRTLTESSPITLLASAQDNEVSYLMPDGNSSLFSTCLMEVLNGHGLSRCDQYVFMSDVVIYLTHEVPRRLGQHPYFQFGESTDFPLALNPKYNPSDASNAITPPPPLSGVPILPVLGLPAELVSESGRLSLPTAIPVIDTRGDTAQHSMDSPSELGKVFDALFAVIQDGLQQLGNIELVKNSLKLYVEFQKAETDVDVLLELRRYFASMGGAIREASATFFKTPVVQQIVNAALDREHQESISFADTRADVIENPPLPPYIQASTVYGSGSYAPVLGTGMMGQQLTTEHVYTDPSQEEAHKEPSKLALEEAMLRRLAEDDVRLLCQYLAKHPGLNDLDYNTLVGTALPVKTHSLIKYSLKHNALYTLVSTMREIRPDVLGDDPDRWLTWADAPVKE